MPEQFQRSVSLPYLLEQLDLKIPAPYQDIQVTGIEFDSRQVKPGNIYVAIPGITTDGHAFIPQAVEHSASALVGSQMLTVPGIPYLQVNEPRQALALLSAAFYGFPARKLTVIGVTGTDGKTTTCNLIYHILQAAGFRAGMISTVNALIGEQVLDTGFHVTTPEAPHVQKYLAEMVNAGLTHVVLEATSHGLSQFRVSGCEFDVAVMTNITHEHLDYHGSFEAYRAAKACLFSELIKTNTKECGNPRLAVLNRDDQSYEYMVDVMYSTKQENKDQIIRPRLVTYGLHPEADIRANNIKVTADKLTFEAVTKNAQFMVESQLVGYYNVANILASIAATVVGLEVSPSEALKGIANVKKIPGRMERIDLGQEFIAIVDFAHTPNALQNVLTTARRMVGGRVIAAFGSAGLRDRAKRHMMAEISSKLADMTILTAEDPRSESLEGILAEMALGAINGGGVEGKTFWRIPDRGEAIRFAVSLAQPGDIVLALGKGHEQSMCFGDIEYPWDDRTAMHIALLEHLGSQAPIMPYLPTQKRD